MFSSFPANSNDITALSNRTTHQPAVSVLSATTATKVRPVLIIQPKQLERAGPIT